MWTLSDILSAFYENFTRMSAHPWASFAWSLRSTASSAVHICGKKLRVILHRASLPGRTLAPFPGFPRARRKTGRSLGTRLDVRSYYINAVRTASYTGHVHGDMVPFIVSVPSELDFEAAGSSVVYTLLLASRALSRCEHDMGALSWLHSKERPPPSLATCKVLRPWALFCETTVHTMNNLQLHVVYDM